MALLWTILSYVGVAAAAVLVYEIVRSSVKRRLQKRFERGMVDFLQSPDLYQQSFKFTNKLVIKYQLLSDPEINAKIEEFAKREGKPLDEVRRKVDTYIEEMVPNFNLLSYYKVGYTIGRAFIHALYDPVVDEERRRILEGLPKDAVPVYVINHRSNVDFVLLGYILAGRASVSYAVGEWARVWPLEHLFKSFGSYLIRRGYKEDLYHKVLERYVQLQARNGVTQAIFPEGRLTRDGALQGPKFGMFQFLSGIEAEPNPAKRLVFIPVGINYDWVIEDKSLLAESEGRPEPKGLGKKIQVLLVMPFVALGLVVVNGIRFLLGRLKLHGYASVSFAEPLVMRDWCQARGVDLTKLSYEERKPHIQEFAKETIARIGQAVPATPATLLSVGLLERPQERYGHAELVDIVTKVRAELENKGVRVVTGREFHKFRHALVKLRRTDLDRGPEMEDVERAFVRQDEAEELVRFAVDVLHRHKILRRAQGGWQVRPERMAYLRYYANSLSHHLGRSFSVPAVAHPPVLSPVENPAARA